MGMEDGFEPLNPDEVLYVNIGRVLMSNPTFKVSEFLDALAQAVSDREDDWPEEKESWFSDGVECQALRFGSGGWQRGRVRLRLEFRPVRALKKAPDREPERSERPLRPRPLDNPYGGDDDLDY